MTGVDVAAIRARADAATEGPWFREYGDVVLASDDPRDVAEGYDEPRGERVFRRAPHRGLRDDQAIADATFAQHARTDVPALLDALAEAERQRDKALVAGEWVRFYFDDADPVAECPCGWHAHGDSATDAFRAWWDHRRVHHAD